MPTSDSTIAEQPGYTESEKLCGETLRAALARANGRIFLWLLCIKCSPIQIVDAARRRQVSA